jgi:hypothetical protein
MSQKFDVLKYMSLCGEKGDVVQQVSDNSVSIFVESLFNMQSLRKTVIPSYIYISGAQCLCCTSF